MKRVKLNIPKMILRSTFVCLMLLTAGFGYTQKPTGALHCLGNGKYCVYQEGMEIKSLFGPS
jgi:hypothetical protein